MGKGEEGEEEENTTPSASTAMDLTEDGSCSKTSSAKKKACDACVH